MCLDVGSLPNVWNHTLKILLPSTVPLRNHHIWELGFTIQLFCTQTLALSWTQWYSTVILLGRPQEDLKSCYSLGYTA